MAIIEIKGECVVVKLRLRPDEVESLLQKHRERYPQAEECEVAGRSVIESQFQDRKVRSFISEVCHWGRGARLESRVLGQNARADVVAAIRGGHEIANSGKVADGVERVRSLRYLGQSFASKLMRFLMPERAVILDSVIRTRLGYADDRDGYQEFLADCAAILDLVRASSLVPPKVRSRLRICDIEAALFAKIQGY